MFYTRIKKEFIKIYNSRYSILVPFVLAMIPTVVSLVNQAYATNIGSHWGSYYYFIGYDTGFGGRKLLGTVMGFLLPGYVTYSEIRPIILGVSLLMLFLMLLWVWKVSKAESSRLLIPLLLLYFVGPFSLCQWVLSGLSMQYMETYMIVLTLAWLFVFVNMQRRWYYYFITLVITLVGVLLHHTFCCTFFPIFVALFCYDSLRGGRLDIVKISIYGFICLINSILLLIIWKFSHMNLSIEELQVQLQARASHDACLHTAPYMLDWMYFKTNSANYNQASAGHLGRQFMFDFAISVVFLLPMILVFAWPWVYAAAKAKTKIVGWGYRLMAIIPIAMTIPIFFIAFDYTRWLVAYFFGGVCLPMVAVAKGDQMITESLERLRNFCRRHPWAVAALVVWSAQLSFDGFFGLRDAIVVRNLLFRHVFGWEIIV